MIGKYGREILLIIFSIAIIFGEMVQKSPFSLEPQDFELLFRSGD